MNAGGHGAQTGRRDRLGAGLRPRRRAGPATSRPTGSASATAARRSGPRRSCWRDLRGSRRRSRGSAARIDEIVRWRREHQPGGQNAGSVFTNPPGDAAGRLIEAAGCKGTAGRGSGRVGEARQLLRRRARRPGRRRARADRTGAGPGRTTRPACGSFRSCSSSASPLPTPGPTRRHHDRNHRRPTARTAADQPAHPRAPHRGAARGRPPAPARPLLVVERDRRHGDRVPRGALAGARRRPHARHGHATRHGDRGGAPRGVRTHDHLLFVDTGAIARRVEQLPWVEHATVRRDFPGTIVITSPSTRRPRTCVSPRGGRARRRRTVTSSRARAPRRPARSRCAVCAARPRSGSCSHRRTPPTCARLPKRSPSRSSRST